MKKYSFLIAYPNLADEPYRTAFLPFNEEKKVARYVAFFSKNKSLNTLWGRLRGRKAEQLFPEIIKKYLFNSDISRLSRHLRSLRKSGKELCFITNQEFLHYDESGKKIKRLKELFPELKVVYFFTDLIDLHSLRQRIIADREKYNADLIISYDRKDADQYHLLQYPIPYSLKKKIRTDNENIYDICFIGRLKDRYSLVLEAYDYFTGKGLSCCFLVVTEEKPITETRDGIRYYKHAVSYKDFLNLESRSKCILEIIQENSVGYTSRVPEAVFLGKTLISNNPELLRDSLYESGKIFVYSDITQLDTERLLANDDKEYRQCDRDVFDRYEFLSFIEEELNKLD